MSREDRRPVTDEERREVRTWNNLGALGPAPEIPFVPDSRLLSRMTNIVQPRAIPVALHFSPEDTARLRRGHHADSMDDKWNIWCEDDVVHFHRSWKGQEIFRVQLVGGSVSLLFVETDPSRHRGTDDDGEVLRPFTEVLRFVVGVTPWLAR
jgi:hypothetical protein